MSHLEIKVAREVLKRLSQCSEPKFLLGWAEGTKIICVACAKDTVKWNDINDLKESLFRVVSLFPAGIGVIGLYYNSPDEATTKTAEHMLAELLCSGAEEFVVGPLLAVVHQLNPMDGGDIADAPGKASVYDTRTLKTVPVTFTGVNGSSLMADALTIRVKGKLPISFQVDKVLAQTLDNLDKSFTAQRDKITSPACAFVLAKSSLLLRNNDACPFRHSALNDNSRSGDMATCIDDDTDDGFQSAPLKKKKLQTLMDLTLLMQTTGQVAIAQTASCVPLIRYERKNFTAVDVTLSIDMVALVPANLPLANLPSLLADGICTQLSAMHLAMVRIYMETSTFRSPKIYHFTPHHSCPVVSVVYPDGMTESDLEPWRRDVHTRLLIPTLRPVVRRIMTHRFANEPPIDGRLLDVHVGLQCPGAPGGQLALVKGSYAYYHYMQDHMDDNGWGCAYRSLQTVVSWFRCQGYTEAPVPTHVQIQQALVDVGDKPASFVNSRRWIGSLEVSYCLDQLIGVSSKIMFVSSGAELASKGQELVEHFTMRGSPIMIGGGVLAHTIIGVYYNDQSGDIKFLVLDPHYMGSEDLPVIQGKGWCGWKAPKFWDKTAYYNLCCPQNPPGI